MQLKLKTSLVKFAVVLSIVVVSKPAYADTNSPLTGFVRFQCGATTENDPSQVITSDNVFELPPNAVPGVPTTIANTVWGAIPIIRWSQSNTYFNGTGWNPPVRCFDVAKRFQNFYDCGSLTPNRLVPNVIPSIQGQAYYPAILVDVNGLIDENGNFQCSSLNGMELRENNRVLLFMLNPINSGGGELTASSQELSNTEREALVQLARERAQAAINQFNEIRDGQSTPIEENFSQ